VILDKTEWLSNCVWKADSFCNESDELNIGMYDGENAIEGKNLLEGEERSYDVK